MAKKEKKPGFIQEFKAFITKGNILDMAVGVSIGGAFSAIITALTNKILMPVINAILSYITGGEGLYTILWASNRELSAGEVSTMTQEAIADIPETWLKGPDGGYYSKLFYIDWSAFIEAIINFLLIALTLFIIIKVAMTVSKKRREFAEAIKAKKAKAEEQTTEAADAPAAEPAPAPVAVDATNAEVLAVLKEIRDNMKQKSISEAVSSDSNKNE